MCLLLLASSQIFKVSSSSVNPDIFYIGNEKALKISSSFSVKIESFLPLVSVLLKADSENIGEKVVVPLKRSSGGIYSGSFEFPEALKKPKTFIFQLYIDGLKTKHSLRVAFTNASVIVPPDPGEAGKVTLEGIDSNKDGVRDDLEREIIFLSPDREDVRRVLRAMAKKMQLVITTQGDHEYFKDLMVRYFAFKNCSEYLMFGEGLQNFVPNSTLWDMGQNTGDRKEVFLKNENNARSYFTTISYNSDACTNSLVKDQY